MEKAEGIPKSVTYIAVHKIGCKSSPASEFLIQSDLELFLGFF